MDERGNERTKIVSISYRQEDDTNKYNYYGNTRDGFTSIAGFFRYIQLENDYILNFAEL